MVFQDYALWPHLSTLANVASPLRMRGVAKAARNERALDALARVGLADMADRFPGTLSGGQQQRVALARSQADVVVDTLLHGHLVGSTGNRAGFVIDGVGSTIAARLPGNARVKEGETVPLGETEKPSCGD